MHFPFLSMWKEQSLVWLCVLWQRAELLQNSPLLLPLILSSVNIQKRDWFSDTTFMLKCATLSDFCNPLKLWVSLAGSFTTFIKMFDRTKCSNTKAELEQAIRRTFLGTEPFMHICIISNNVLCLGFPAVSVSFIFIYIHKESWEVCNQHITLQQTKLHSTKNCGQ